MRCADCSARYTESLWQFGNWRYARCPKCYRMDLGTWSESHYIIPWNIRLLLGLGAKKFRCEICRCNFASFRWLKERFSFHRYRKQKKEELDRDRSADLEAKAPAGRSAPGLEKRNGSK